MYVYCFGYTYIRIRILRLFYTSLAPGKGLCTSCLTWCLVTSTPNSEKKVIPLVLIDSLITLDKVVVASGRDFSPTLKGNINSNDWNNLHNAASLFKRDCLTCLWSTCSRWRLGIRRASSWCRSLRSCPYSTKTPPLPWIFIDPQSYHYVLPFEVWQKRQQRGRRCTLPWARQRGRPWRWPTCRRRTCWTCRGAGGCPCRPPLTPADIVCEQYADLWS